MFMGLATATKTGLTWDIPLTDITNQMLGIDATHLVESFALVQDEASGKFLPAMTLMGGSHFGGGDAPADIKVLAADVTAKKFQDFGVQHAAASFDRHLYSNYLGGNPGNQGRNFASAMLVKNPFATAASDPKFLLMHALTAKAPEDVLKPEIKGSSYISLLPMFQAKTVAPPPPAGTPGPQVGGTGVGGGDNAQPQAGDPQPANEVAQSDPGTPGTPGSFSSGCSMATAGSTSASGIFFFLVGMGLVTLARRRRA
jgi:MYXO-CTERM domain-containing protein